MATNEVEIDPVLHALGPMGVFACVQCCVFFLGYLSDAYQLFSYVFTGQDVEHRCAAPANDSVSILPDLDASWRNSSLVHYGQCAITVTANVSGDVTTREYPCLYGMTYEGPKDTSIVSEFDLVCGRAPLAGLTQTLLMFGSGLGAIICPWLSDLYGRKRIIVISEILMFTATIAAGFSPNYVFLAVVKFLMGVIQTGTGLIAVTAGVELFPSSHRALTSGFWSTLFWAMCIASLSPIAYLLRVYSWRILQIALCGSSAVVVFMLLFLKEPVRWLVANGKTDEAVAALKQACKWNHKDEKTVLDIFHSLGLDQPHHLFHSRTHLKEQETPERDAEKRALSINDTHDKPKLSFVGEDHPDVKQDPEESLSFLDLCRNALLRKNALLSLFIWFVDSLTYNALYLMSGSLALSLYVSFFLNAVVEGASCVLMIIMLRRYGRKTTIGAFHVITGLGLISSSVCFHFKDNDSLQIVGTVLSLIGKMGIGGAFNVLFLYTPEIFPTNIRNRALGISMAAATVGGMVAPYSDILAEYAIWAPGTIFGAGCLLVVLFLRALPESKGKELPQTIRDLRAWYDVTSSKESNERK